jgi:3-deoxy-D-manno-octulosonic-acid transferase
VFITIDRYLWLGASQIVNLGNLKF